VESLIDGSYCVCFVSFAGGVKRLERKPLRTFTDDCFLKVQAAATAGWIDYTVGVPVETDADGKPVKRVETELLAELATHYSSELSSKAAREWNVRYVRALLLCPVSGGWGAFDGVIVEKGSSVKVNTAKSGPN
jgi:hypothetical protein